MLKVNNNDTFKEEHSQEVAHVKKEVGCDEVDLQCVKDEGQSLKCRLT